MQELLSMLGREDPETRENAAAAIASRLAREKFATTNVEPALVNAVFSKISLLLQNDRSSHVRLAGISILVQLDTWTNTAPALIQASADTDRLVRIRAITAFLYVSKNRHEQIPPIVLSRLGECFDPDADAEILWQASFAAGEAGSPQFLPLLKIVSKNPNAKVRLYASEAIKKLESSSPPPQSK